MSEPDIFDRVAATIPRDVLRAGFESATNKDIAHAFRAAFAQRTCASCQHWGGREKRDGQQMAPMCYNAKFPSGGGYGADPTETEATFSCSLWAAKPEAK